MYLGCLAHGRLVMGNGHLFTDPRRYKASSLGGKHRSSAGPTHGDDLRDIENADAKISDGNTPLESSSGADRITAAESQKITEELKRNR